MKIRVHMAMLVLLAFSLLAWIAAAAGVTGAWKGTLTDADGRIHDLTLNLKSDGELVGSVIGLPPEGAKQEISNGKVAGDQISFDVSVPAGERGGGVMLHFSGKVSGNQIQGSFTTPSGRSLAVTVTKE